LNEVKESIIALRERKASYETIRAMLHESAGIEVSHQTVARYCREVLDSARAKKPRRPKTPAAEQPAAAQAELPAPPPSGQPRSRGPRIYAPKVFSAAAQASPVAATEERLKKKSAHAKKQEPLGPVSATNARYTVV
jgi:hypothetical protein